MYNLYVDEKQLKEKNKNEKELNENKKYKEKYKSKNIIYKKFIFINQYRKFRTYV
jgi:hypothetical protein